MIESPSFKKIKSCPSQEKFKENIYRTLFPSPNSSYDCIKWIQSNETSFNSFHIEQEIDKLLKIAVPEIIQPQYQTRSPIRFQPNIQQDKIIQEALLEEPAQTQNVNEQNPFPFTNQQQQQSYSITDTIQDNQFSTSSSNFINSLLEKYNSKETKQMCGNVQIMNSLQVIPEEINWAEEKQEESFSYNSTSNKIEKSHKQKKQNKKPRITNTVEVSFNEEQNTKQHPHQIIEKPIFNTNQQWGKMKIRKEAKKKEIYKAKEYQDLFKLLPGLYLHESEGYIKLDKLRQAKDESVYQQFEISINPSILIGPITLKAGVKVHVRFKTGYTGIVYSNKELNQTIPTNKNDCKTFKSEPLILGNSSDTVVKLVCCVVTKE